MYIGSPEKRETTVSVETNVGAVTERIRSQYNYETKKAKKNENEISPEGLIRGLVGEMVLSNDAKFVRENVMVGQEHLKNGATLQLQSVEKGKVPLFDADGKRAVENGRLMSADENKLNLLMYLSGRDLPDTWKFGKKGLDYREAVKQDPYYTDVTEMPDMWAGVLGEHSLSIPVEVKCYLPEEMKTWVETVNSPQAVLNREGMHRVKTKVDDQEMDLGFDPGKQLDLLDYVRGRVGLPDLAGQDSPRLMLLRIPRGYERKQLETLRMVAERGVYGDKKQKIALIIEELPMAIDELNNLVTEVTAKLSPSTQKPEKIVENEDRIEVAKREAELRIEAVNELLKAVDAHDREAYELARIRFKVRFGLT